MKKQKRSPLLPPPVSVIGGVRAIVASTEYRSLKVAKSRKAGSLSEKVDEIYRLFYQTFSWYNERTVLTTIYKVLRERKRK